MTLRNRQEALDAHYWRHGPCCAGCDYWRAVNSLVGECRRAAPVAGRERLGLLEPESPSLAPDTGHPLTPRDHWCGDFADTFDWTQLSPAYRKRIGAA